LLLKNVKMLIVLKMHDVLQLAKYCQMPISKKN